jgi:hypothetical protein
VDQGKWLKETRLGVDLVSNSNLLHGDVGITGLVIPNFGKQIIMSLSCLPSALLYSSIVLPRYILCVLHCLVDIVSIVLPRYILCVLHCIVDIVYIYLRLSLGVHCIYSLN